jgi:pimeloyl-ACP methyl ester carboxylesterase
VGGADVVTAAVGPRPETEAAADQLRLPPGYRLDLPHRGTTFFREVAGPPGAPTVLLVHGWMASAGLNWFRAFGPLGEHFRVIAPDLRGHARGLRSPQRFTLTRCADDLAEMLVELDTGPVIAVGYSMGGPIVQLLWRRHRDLVDGLVLCATSGGFLPIVRERIVFQTLMAAAAVGTRAGGRLVRAPVIARRQFLPVTLPDLPEPAQVWAAGEFRRHDVRQVVEAGHAIGTYSARRWLHEIDVPTAVIVTSGDRAVPPHLQHAMAGAIPGASVHVVEGGHVVCAEPRFGSTLTEVCLDVASRAAWWHAAAQH